MSANLPLPRNRLKRGLLAGAKQVGLWLTLESLTATEVAAGAGFDWLLLDLEHSCIDLSAVPQHLRAAEGGSAEVVVRVPSHDPVIVKRLLDAGLRSIMFPMVQSAADAQAVVAATRYPPAGVRGVAGNSRANRYNRIASYFEAYQQEQCVIVQIESARGLEAIDAIGAVDGVDGLFIGPNDLAASLGHMGMPGSPPVREAIASALTRIRATGKAAGILNFNPAEARELLGKGFGFIAVGSDTGLLARGTETLLASVKSGS